jgi:hypothetical protein
MKRRPLIAFSVHMYDNADGPGYCVGTEAYGLEMTIDDEWPVDTVILAPPRYVADMADVRSMGVQTGASYFPGNQDLQAIVSAGGSWLLVYPEDPINLVEPSGLSILLMLDSPKDIDKVLPDLTTTADRLSIAFYTDGLETPSKAQKKAASTRKKLESRGLGNVRILASGSFDIERFRKFFAMEDIDGVLVLNGESGEMINLIADSAGASIG